MNSESVVLRICKPCYTGAEDFGGSGRGKRGRAPLYAALDECDGALAQAEPGHFFDFDANFIEMADAREEVAGEIPGELFDARDGLLARQGVDGVLHGVGRQDKAVIGLGEGVLECAFHKDFDVQFFEFVMRGKALNVGQPHFGFAVGIENDVGHLISSRDKLCSRRD